ncbi:hypothetical protein KM176_22575 [Pseudooceanicola sp. CBS1P-1]|uniref:Uncharacterized protein n=1 Tax=Pseudooceanicola albus TaxID=2692189 RepID=A0A6L7GDV4_9RHOB|nr:MULTISPECIES: hypothetical protein [Pseudooceanicola]MBT9386655.1 hypothetical protein [Pseudooceanicola endophyticus]MXN20933.1 hypothetical protein [Pseudooceanicola albus]
MTFRTRIAAIRYNPTESAYEASVTLYDAGRVYTYPVALRASLDMPYEEAEVHLSELAGRHHERGLTRLRSRRPREELRTFEDLPAIVQQTSISLWDRLRRRVA